MSNPYYGQSRVPARSAIEHDDPDRRAAERQAAVFQPLAQKIASGQRLSDYEQGALRAVALGRGPRQVAAAAQELLRPYERRGAPTTGLTEQQVRKAINDAMGEVRQQIQDLIRDLEDDR